MLPTMPTIVFGPLRMWRASCALTRICRPIGLTSAKNRSAARSLIKTTSGAAAVSRLSNGRPDRIGILIVLK
jgi:hypothetical protein